MLYYIFAVLAVFQGIGSLIGGVKFWRHVHDELQSEVLRARIDDNAPQVSIFAPCRGLDEGLADNLAALFKLDYPRYELIFVIDNVGDKSRRVIEAVQGKFPNIKSKLVIAGAARGCAQKIHNLNAGVAQADAATEIFAFVDSDARPAVDWLRVLVRPLQNENIGATTGYRWFVPKKKTGFASQLRAVWNASVTSSLGSDMSSNFCWGGAMCVRRKTFESLNISSEWSKSLSDDFVVTRTLHKAKRRIYFVPQALTASFEDCTFAELLEFSTRQVKITRVYAVHLWRIIFWSNLIFLIAFISSITLALKQFLGEAKIGAPVLVLALLLILGMCKAALRLFAVRAAWTGKADLQAQVSDVTTIFAQLILWVASAPLYFYNACAALRLPPRIAWRGITYELKSAHETVIIENKKAIKREGD